MASLNKIAADYAEELRMGIAWVIVWKKGRSWDAQAVWLDCDTDTFEVDDLELVHEVLKQDPQAVMLNGFVCGHFGEDMNVNELAAGVRWHFENGYNRLIDSSAFPEEDDEQGGEERETDGKLCCPRRADASGVAGGWAGAAGAGSSPGAAADGAQYREDGVDREILLQVKEADRWHTHGWISRCRSAACTPSIGTTARAAATTW